MTHQQPQIGMALMPETNVDLSLFNSWNTGLNSSDFQVFAVTELPSGPVLDLSVLSEKPSNPVIDSVRPNVHPSSHESSESVTVKKQAKIDGPRVRVPATLASSTPSATFDQTATPHSQSTSNALTPTENLDALCNEMEGTCERLAALLPRE